MMIFLPGLNQAGIHAKKADHFATPWTDLSAEGFEIAPGERPNPTPPAAEDVNKPDSNGIPLLFTGENSLGHHVEVRGGEHGIRRRTAPTSLALHEQFCAVAHCRSCDGLPVSTMPQGIPGEAGEGWAWSVRRRGKHIRQKPRSQKRDPKAFNQRNGSSPKLWLQY